MSGSAIFDLAVGVVFVFLLVSLISSQISDRISTWLRWRAKDLEAGLRKFVAGETNTQWVADLYKNPLIQSLVPNDTTVTKVLKNIPLINRWVYPGKNPFGIPANTFALALFDNLLNAEGDDAIKKLVNGAKKLSDDLPFKSALLSILQTADGNYGTARKNFEDWYDATMYRSTVIYQQHMWGFSFILAAIIVVGLNVDTIGISMNLWHDSALRTAMAGAAAKFATEGKQQDAYTQINSINLPVGWQVASAPAGAPAILGRTFIPVDWTKRPPEEPLGSRDYISKLVGWLITALAAAQGAPFWFDLIRKMTQKG